MELLSAAAQDAMAATLASSNENALALDAIELCRHTARVWSAAWVGTDEFGLENSEQLAVCLWVC